MRRQLDGLNDKTLREGFWDDPDAAKRLLSQRSAVEQTLGRIDGLGREVDEMRELLELAEGEHDASMVSEVGGQVATIDKRVRELELERMLSGTHDRANAIVSINPGAGGVDAQHWAEMLMRMYLRWCERRGFKTEIVNFQPGD